jgi:hypothetical protein
MYEKYLFSCDISLLVRDIFAAEPIAGLPIICHVMRLKSESLFLIETSFHEMPVNSVVFY